MLGQLWIVPIHNDAPNEDVIFEPKIFEEFVRLFGFYNHKDIQTKEIRRFYDKYGPLQGAQRERVKDAMGIIDILTIHNRKRNNDEALSMLYQLPRQEFEPWENGKIFLTFKATTLAQAIFTYWALNWDDVGLTKCKFFEDFGERSKCQKLFKKKHAKKEFCSPGCRKAYFRKKGEKL